MRYIASAALIFTLGVGGLYAYERPVKMTFSGTAGASAIDLQYPGRMTGEDNFAGNGNLGSFTFREVESNGGSPQESSTCSGATKLYFTLQVGAGVLSFGDGSSLVLNLREGSDCIDTEALVAHCIRVFDIKSGTGRFKNAKGTLTMEELLHPILANSSGPVFFVSAGGFTGSISGVQRDEDGHDDH
ncbi:MAG: hypothetical protein ACJ746_22845 [Bryobacteraceae bacterium]